MADYNNDLERAHTKIAGFLDQLRHPESACADELAHQLVEWGCYGVCEEGIPERVRSLYHSCIARGSAHLELNRGIKGTLDLLPHDEIEALRRDMLAVAEALEVDYRATLDAEDEASDAV